LVGLVGLVGCNSSKKEEIGMLDAKIQVETPVKESVSKKTGAFLEITVQVAEEHRPADVGVYSKYRQPFLKQIDGAVSKDLLVRTDDVQVIHGFETVAQANAYLTATLFSNDIVGELGPLLAAASEIRVYAVFEN